MGSHEHWNLIIFSHTNQIPRQLLETLHIEEDYFFQFASCVLSNFKQFKYFIILLCTPFNIFALEKNKTKRHMFLLLRSKTFIGVLFLEEVLFRLFYFASNVLCWNVTGHTLTFKDRRWPQIQFDKVKLFWVMISPSFLFTVCWNITILISLCEWF